MVNEFILLITISDKTQKPPRQRREGFYFIGADKTITRDLLHDRHFGGIKHMRILRFLAVF